MDIRTEREKIISALTAARMEKGLSQEALARMIGTQRSNICRIESGAAHSSRDRFLKIRERVSAISQSQSLEEAKNISEEIMGLL